MVSSTDSSCRRVAALGFEIASRMDLPGELCDQVRAAALHPPPALAADSPGFERLLQAVLSEPIDETAPDSEITDEPISGILEVARLFDSGIQYAVYEPRSVEAILNDLSALAADGFLNAEAVAALRSFRAQVPPFKPRVYPAVFIKAMALMRNEDIPLSEIDAVVRTDQVLACSILRVANSALYAPAEPISTLALAMQHIGLDMARKALLAASAQPLFASPTLRKLWKHSLEVAAISEQLARTSGRFDPGEAFVAGLLHDIGRLAIEELRLDAVTAHSNLAHDGGCAVLADQVVAGADHGEIAADPLRRWNLPETLVEAIEYHHRPELKPDGMAPLLYAAEFAAEADEDTASIVRSQIAMNAVGAKNVAELIKRARPDERVIEALASAA